MNLYTTADTTPLSAPIFHLPLFCFNCWQHLCVRNKSNSLGQFVQVLQESTSTKQTEVTNVLILWASDAGWEENRDRQDLWLIHFHCWYLGSLLILGISFHIFIRYRYTAELGFLCLVTKLLAGHRQIVFLVSSYSMHCMMISFDGT